MSGALAAGALLLFFGSGCGSKQANSQEKQPLTPAAAVSQEPGYFRDVTEKAGIRFTYTNGATGDYKMLETTPGGCAFLDYDRDGRLDVFLVQSGPTPGTPPGEARPPCALYRNNGDGTFRDVSQEAGIAQLDQGYAQCVAVADYDNDGFPDIYLTAFGGSHLLHNTGKGKFEDVTARAGVAGDKKRWATGAAWGDYDRDGRLDLIALHYAPWSPEKDQKCINANKKRTYCSPEVYGREKFILYRNLGGGRFADVAQPTQVDKASGRGLAVAWLDYNQDGWPDIYIACDITPNVLLRNNGGKSFTEVGLQEGVAYGSDATILSGMGIAVGDYACNGWQSLVVTNFSGQPNSVYKGVNGTFEDATYPSGVGEASLNFLAWGVEFLDYDNDGWLDLVVGNGHVDPFIAESAQNVTYAERKLLFHNDGNGLFHDKTEHLGDLKEERVTRGLAVGDFNNDGRVDILDNAHNMPARLYENVGQGGGYVVFRLEGVKSNRDAVGALVWVTAGGRRRLAEVRAGSSYASTSDLRLHFGLGDAARIEKVEVRWPTGQKQTFTDLAPNAFYYLEEGGKPVPDPLAPKAE